jgi:undecaprenyl phosphate-alpha-L-ara4N flippase subunit ArnE
MYNNKNSIKNKNNQNNKMSTKLWAALLVVFTTFLNSIAQILYKFGAEKLEFNLLSILTNYYIIGGVTLYIIGGVLVILALRHGEVSVLYPIIATGYIWVSLLSVMFLGETMNVLKWLGIAAIIGGIVLIGFGSKKAIPGAGVI